MEISRNVAMIWRNTQIHLLAGPIRGEHKQFGSLIQLFVTFLIQTRDTLNNSAKKK